MPVKTSCKLVWIGMSAALCLMLSSGNATADIFKYTDKHGRVYLTDKPAHDGYRLLVKTWKGWEEQKGVDYRNFSKNKKKFTPTIERTAARYRLPVALVHAVVAAESAYDPQAVSSAGAVGLMQLMPGTASRFGVSNRRDPAANVNAGSRYLSELLKMFDNNLVLALAAYNAGENAVIKHGHKVPPYKETRGYVRKVLDFYKEYSEPVEAG